MYQKDLFRKTCNRGPKMVTKNGHFFEKFLNIGPKMTPKNGTCIEPLEKFRNFEKK